MTRWRPRPAISAIQSQLSCRTDEASAASSTRITCHAEAQGTQGANASPSPCSLRENTLVRTEGRTGAFTMACTGSRTCREKQSQSPAGGRRLRIADFGLRIEGRAHASASHAIPSVGRNAKQSQRRGRQTDGKYREGKELRRGWVSGASVENKANGKGEVVCQVPEGPSHVAQPPSAGITAGGGGAPCVSANGTRCAKQSQHRR